MSLYFVIFLHMFKGICIFNFLNFLLLVFPLILVFQYYWTTVAVFCMQSLTYNVHVFKVNFDFSDNVLFKEKLKTELLS